MGSANIHIHMHKYLCNKEWHKSYQYKAKTEEEKKKKPTNKISNIYINKVDKKATTPYLI
jgi:hypothetical protein